MRGSDQESARETASDQKCIQYQEERARRKRKVSSCPRKRRRRRHWLSKTHLVQPMSGVPHQKASRVERETKNNPAKQSVATSSGFSVIVRGSIPSAGMGHCLLLLFALLLIETIQVVKALNITNFRVPSYVPITLPTKLPANAHAHSNSLSLSPGELAKPILFDCDYTYEPQEDARLTVRWFRDKEPEPLYQWLPELNIRHFADWLRPLVDESFVSDPNDPLKRYRSILIKRLSMNLTGQYSCLVSSLANQETRSASLIVYQPPRAFTFEHRIYPPPVASIMPKAIQAPQLREGAGYPFISHASTPPPPPPALGDRIRTSGSPTQFKGLNGSTRGHPPATPTSLVRPPNNNVGVQQPAHNQTDKIVYTHDGRPLRRKQRSPSSIFSTSSSSSSSLPSVAPVASSQFVIQLHHFQCQASQVTPRPVIMLTVKRQADSIAQYLHESSTSSIRTYQVSQQGSGHHQSASQQQQQQRQLKAQQQLTLGPNSSSYEQAQQKESLVTLYDITVSATVALNVSLVSHSTSATLTSMPPLRNSSWRPPPALVEQPAGISTVLNFRRGQRMSFECHLEITGTEFEKRERIYINEEEVYQFAEEQMRRQRNRQRYIQTSVGSSKNQKELLQDEEQQEDDDSFFGGLESSLKFSSNSAPSSSLAVFPILVVSHTLTQVAAVCLLMRF